MPIDIIQLITNTSPTLAIAIYVIYQMRLDRTDALRRESQYSEALRADRKELIERLTENTDTNRLLADRIHDLSKTITALQLRMDANALRAQQGTD